jgi:hypothetical protein
MDMFFQNGLFLRPPGAGPYANDLNTSLASPSAFNNPFALRPAVTSRPVARRPAQASQVTPRQEDDPVRAFLALAWKEVIQAREPQWKKDSPGSLLLYKLFDEAAKSSRVTAEQGKWLNVMRALTFLYGLDQSDL